MFDKFIGIGYSGSGTPVTRTPGLQVYAATNDGLPRRVKAREWGRRVKWHKDRPAAAMRRMRCRVLKWRNEL